MSKLTSATLGTSLAFTVIASLAACGPHHSLHHAKTVGDPKTTTVVAGGAASSGGVAANSSGLAITNPTLTAAIAGEGGANANMREATFTINDGNTQVLLDVYWKVGSSNSVTRNVSGGSYGVEVKCANDDCSQFVALFRINSPNLYNLGSIQTADLYEDFGATAGGVLIVHEVPSSNYASIDDAVSGLMDLADKDFI